VDGSLEALATCRRVTAVPLAAADLRALAIRTAAVDAYVSLGVVEHDPEGPDAILAEARRVLAPGGTLVISVPYVNGLRRLASPWLRRRARVVAEAGGAFYQYAFSRAELLAALARHGFAPLTAKPYDPARVLRSLLPRRLRRSGGRETSVPAAAPAGMTPPLPGMPARCADSAQEAVKRLARGVLYTSPALRLLGHMLLVVGRRA
jgi:SAM-dependent methyltransferase